jgi:hypothetical protein
MSQNLGINFSLTANASQARSTIAELRQFILGEVGNITGGVSNASNMIGRDLAAATGSVGKFALAFNPATLAITATVGAVIGLGSELFSLVERTENAGAKIYDLSRNTGLSAGTLSALQLAADQSGTSVETLAQGFGRFDRLVGQADAGNKKAIATLREFGIKPVEALQNLDAAFDKVLKKILELPPGIERDIEAQRAFGARGGAQLVAALEQTGGSIEKLREQAKATGRYFDSEGAAAADTFRDHLRFLAAESEGVGTVFAQKMAPEILRAIDDISAALGGNQKAWDEWADWIADKAANVRANIARLAAEMSSLFSRDILTPGLPGERGEEAAGESLRKSDIARGKLFVLGEPMAPIPAARGRADLEDQLRQFRQPDLGGGGGGGGKSKKAKDTSQQELEDRLRTDDAHLKAIEANLKREEDATERSYRLRLTSLQDYTKSAVDLENQRWQATRETLLKEIADVDEHDKKRASKLEQLNARLVDEEGKSAKRIQDLHDQQREKETEAEREYQRGIVAIQDAGGVVRIARLKDQLDRGLALESETEKQIGKIELEALDRREKLLRADLEAAGKNAEEKKKIGIELGLLEVQRGALVEATTDRVDAALRKELEARRAFNLELRKIHDEYIADLLDLLRLEVDVDSRRKLFKKGTEQELKNIEREAEKERHRRALEDIETRRKELAAEAQTFDQFVAAENAIRKKREQEAKTHEAAMKKIDQGGVFADLLKEINDERISFTEFAATSLKGLFDSVSAGLKGMTDEYVKYGTTSGKVVRQAVAEQLSALAQLALQQGLYATAQGVWDLFFNPARAASDFLAAGLWFAAAGAAAYAGRKVAGNAFGAGSAASAGAGASASGADNQPKNQTFTFNGGASPSSQVAGAGSQNLTGNPLHDLRAQFEMQRQQMARQHAENQKMMGAVVNALTPFTTAQPHEVVMKGLQAQNFAIDAEIAASTIRQMSSDGGYVEEKARILRIP